MKRKVSFTIADGLKPGRTPSKAFSLKCPIPLTIPAGAEVKIDLGVSCSHPLHVYQSRGLAERGLNLIDGIWAMHDEGQTVVVQLKNNGKETIQIEERETICRAVVIDNSDVVVEE